MGPVNNQAIAASVSASAPATMPGVRPVQRLAAWNAYGHASVGRAGMLKKAPSCNDIFLAIYDGTLQLRSDKAAQDAAHLAEGAIIGATGEIDPLSAYLISAYFEIMIEMDKANLDILYFYANSYNCMGQEY
ncbi:MAG: hypothetical protein ABI625_17480 [bacterium]